MASPKATESSKKTERLSAEDKRRLRASLNERLQESASNPDAASEALRLALKLHVKVPVQLRSRRNIAQAYSFEEVSRLFERLGDTQYALDLSEPLFALRDLVIKAKPKPTVVLSVARRVNQRIRRHESNTSQTLDGLSLNKIKRKVVFTEGTVTAIIDWTLHAIPRILDSPKKTGPRYHRTAVEMLKSVEIVWRQSVHPCDPTDLIIFVRSLRRLVPTSLYGQLLDEPSFGGFMRDFESSLESVAETALVEARLKDLETIVDYAQRNTDKGTVLWAQLQRFCQTRVSEMVPEAIEWIAHRSDSSTVARNVWMPADPSQSSKLNYVALALLASWEAAEKSDASLNALETTKRMARELFHLDLAGKKDEVVPYVELHHRLSESNVPLPELVKIVKPGVRWTDGTRTRFLIPAIVEAHNQT